MADTNIPQDERPFSDIVADFGTALTRLEQSLDSLGQTETPAAQAEHRAIVDGRTAAFSGDRQARAALSAWLLDGADILKRCRVDNPYDIAHCREGIAEIAMIALRSFDSYRGVQADGLEYKELRQWVERELAGEGEAR